MISKTKVLVAENEAVIAMDIEVTLKKSGYDVTGIVLSSEELLREVNENRPDIVLMDLMLKGDLDGIEAAHKLSLFYNIPIVFISAFSDEETIEKVKKASPYGFITKPFGKELLEATIEVALYRFRMKLNGNTSKALIEKTAGTNNQKKDVRDYKKEWIRATFIVRKEHLDKIKALAYWDRKKVKEVMDEALESYLKEKDIESIAKSNSNVR